MKLRQEEFTIENFVDGVIEVVHQVSSPERAKAIQDLLHKYYTEQIDIDSFAFEFTMLLLEKRK